MICQSRWQNQLRIDLTDELADWQGVLPPDPGARKRTLVWTGPRSMLEDRADALEADQQPLVGTLTPGWQSTTPTPPKIPGRRRAIASELQRHIAIADWRQA